MAKIFPSRLQREITEDPRRSSEVAVYDSLRDQLSDEWHVFYSSPWLGTNPDGSEIDGEADFLVAHADKGILSIEVKGGRVSIGKDNQWTSKDRFGITRNIKNPVAQARLSKYQLLDKLKHSPKWVPRFITARHGVILPHSGRPERDFRADMPLKLFAFEEDMPHLQSWVDARLASADGADQGSKSMSLGIDGLAALDDMIARPIVLQVRLHTNIAQDLKEIALKTNEQILILRELEVNSRMAIAGAAGTGKTVLAVEKAMMLAQQGRRTLLLCFNRPLSLTLPLSVASYPLIHATHFHQFCREVAEKAGKDTLKYDARQDAVDFVDNFAKAGLQEYDAIIIDEGQDFDQAWLESLEIAVKGGPGGVLYIFYDNNQNVMTTSAEYIRQLPVPGYLLSRNFRNTQRIFSEGNRYYKGQSIRAIGPIGTPVIWSAVGGGDPLRITLSRRVGALVQNEGMDAGDIAILLPDQQLIDALRVDGLVRIGSYPTTNAERRKAGAVVVDTIRRFKGLESPVVLLVVESDMKDRAELLYTAMTRPQCVLEVFGPPEMLRKMRSSE